MSLETLKSALAAGGGRMLGQLVWWSIADAVVDRVTLEKHWLGAGLPAALLPEPPTAEKALKLAVRDAVVGQSERLIRLAKEAENELIFAVVRENRVGDGSLEYTQEAKLVLDRAGKLLTTDAPAHDLVVAALGSFQRWISTHSPDDVRRTVVKALHAFCAVSLRDHGGVYWIPPTYSAETAKLAAAVSQIGSSKMWVLPVHETQQGNAALGAAAKGALEDELAHLEQELESFVSSPPQRPSTLVKRLDAFEALRSRAELYRTVLQVHVDQLDTKLDRMTGVVDELLKKKVA